MLKADFFDNVYLQQNAFDKVDGATPKDRQVFVFDRVLGVLDKDFDFKDKSVARKTMVAATDMFRNWNYAAEGSEEYKKLLGDIEAFIESGAIAQAAAE